MFRYQNDIVLADMKHLYDSIPRLEELKGKRVFVTGATGMLATYCCYFLHYLNEVHGFGIEITALVRNEEKARRKFEGPCGSEHFKLLLQDIMQPIHAKESFDYILHMSGSASAYAITHEPESIIISNVLGMKNVLDFAVKSTGTRVLFTSTREVYGKLDEQITSISEDMMGVLDISSSRSCYPESKRMAENLLAVYREKYKLDFVNVRIAHSYGPGMALKNDGRVMADLISNAAEGQDIVLKSDGMMKRAFCYLSDAISAIFTVLLLGGAGETYNIANETEEITIRDLASLVASCSSHAGLKVTYKEISEEERKGYLNIPRVKLDTHKLEQLGWKPTVRLEDGVKKTLQSLE